MLLRMNGERVQFGRGSWVVGVVVAVAAVYAILARPDVVTKPATDHVRQMQIDAEATGHASWGHWGDQPQRYAAWSNHSNRLIPVYTFGMRLDAVSGGNSLYRDRSRQGRDIV